ncbi:YbaB/EbfC family nucleoid-associated protein [Actinophytocola oryzae]|nr:YbaB/EbfC family nucleoid-associated protein [Actinophytocola oryzae]
MGQQSHSLAEAGDHDGGDEDLRRSARETRAALGRLRVRVASRDGTVSAVLTGDGRLADLTFHAGAFDHGPVGLAGLVVETVGEAYRMAGRQVTAALRPLLDLPFDPGTGGPACGHATAPAFGDLVREHRRRTGWSQQELADKACLGVRGLRKIETGGVVSPRPATVRLLSDALGLDGERREAFFLAASISRG